MASELRAFAGCQMKAYFCNEHVKKKVLIQVRVTNADHYPLGFHQGVVSFVVTLTGFEKDLLSFLF